MTAVENETTTEATVPPGTPHPTTTPERPRSTSRARSRLITDWDPEDTVAWEAGNKDIARRNLVWSVATEHIGFSIWSIWSVMVLFMPQAVYGFTPADKFFLVAVPTLVGAVLRVPYTMATATFGGRNWAVFSGIALLVPTTATWYLMVHPGHSYTTFLLVAGLAGLGGGNFASSMTNINAFYPQRMKGWALGLNAGGGNIGVPVVQVIGLLVIASLGNRRPEIVCAVYLVLLAVVSIGAAMFMDNLDHQTANAGAMKDVLGHADSWLISLLYIGTFGSFIGFSFAFGQVLQITFLAGLTSGAPTAAQSAAASLHAAQIAFIGPLLGSVSRVLGGRLADRRGGGLITLVTFVSMVVAGGILVASGTADDATKGAATGLQLTGLIAGFILLFILSGIGNGSVYKMIPAIFERKSLALRGVGAEQRQQWSRAMSGALIGIAGAIGALGGVGINLLLRTSYAGSAKSATAAFWVFTAFYVVAALVTWVRFVRRPKVESVSAATVPDVQTQTTT